MDVSEQTLCMCEILDSIPSIEQTKQKHIKLIMLPKAFHNVEFTCEK